VARNKNRAGKSDQRSSRTATLKPAKLAADARSDRAYAPPPRSWKPKPRIAALVAVAALAIGGLASVFVTEGAFVLLCSSTILQLLIVLPQYFQIKIRLVTDSVVRFG